jgi:carbamoyltransferase
LKILGISAFYHDSAAAIIVDGIIIAAAEQERFSRIKHDSKFPKEAINFCLKEAEISLAEIDAVVFYEKPFLKFERLLESYFWTAPKGLRSFAKSMPNWFSEKLFIKQRIFKQLKKIDLKVPKDLKILFPEHHLSHAASAYYSSPFQDAAILTIDGVGEWTTASISHGKGNSIELIKEMHFPNSVGLLYSAFTYFLGFKVNSGEYKLMGLAGYGNLDDHATKSYIELIKEKLVTIYEDGSIQLNMRYFSFLTSMRMVHPKKWESIFGMNKRTEAEPFDQRHANLALAIQLVTEEIVLKLAEEAKRITRSDNICLSGGVALNCVANGRLERARVFKEIYIFPASGDSGGALGAALAVDHIYFNRPKTVDTGNLMGSLLGPSIDNEEILQIIKKYELTIKQVSNEKLFATIAQDLNEGRVIAWCQGRMEYGPRALGNRSILGDPRVADMQLRINQKVKKRESFRPFAPAILKEQAARYFELDADSPYMLLVHPIKEEYRSPLPSDFSKHTIKEKLLFNKSDFPAISHADYSSRIQTVSGEENPDFRQLLEHFYALSGCPMLINTSFNERGEPIVRTAADAFGCFMRTDIDVLVLNNYIFDKKELTYLDASQFIAIFEND